MPLNFIYFFMLLLKKPELCSPNCGIQFSIAYPHLFCMASRLISRNHNLVGKSSMWKPFNKKVETWRRSKSKIIHPGNIGIQLPAQSGRHIDHNNPF